MLAFMASEIISLHETFEFIGGDFIVDGCESRSIFGALERENPTKIFKLRCWVSLDGFYRIFLIISFTLAATLCGSTVR